jgi:DNA polymerase-3 subunit alpha
LDLDEVEAFRDSSIIAKQAELFNDPSLSWKEKQALKDRGAEYMVAGLVTDFSVRDGKNSGEKIAFVTLEDYSGSCSFRLGDRDYMRLRDKIDLQRFLVFKIKYAVLADGRVFINVTDVLELKQVFDQFVKSLTIVMDVNDLRKNDIEFFQKYFIKGEGTQKLSFHFNNPEDNSQMNLVSLKCGFKLDGDILELISQEQNYQFYLN